MNNDWNKRSSSEELGQSKRSAPVIESLVSGSISSASTTIIYQPLELLKTRIQLQDQLTSSNSTPKVFGRATRSATKIIRDYNIGYLWRGTGASLIRSVPGVGLYYASLNFLQINISEHINRPDNPTQAFYFGLSARSMISFILLPVTVIKVRYESGQHKYTSLSAALIDAYLRNGWVGIAPTVLRDSLFSGIYYMCYTKLKTYNFLHDNMSISIVAKQESQLNERPAHSLNFFFGIVSGLVASLITNPIDVLKTKIQVDTIRNKSMRQSVVMILRERHGYMRFFDGLVPRSLRRTLIAATTWTIYEYLMDSLR